MPKTILVIDDDADFLKLIEHILTLHGYEPELQSSAQAGLAYFEANSEETKLVIIDVLMPGMMGPELVQRLRGLQPKIKVLFASAYAVEIIDQATQCAFPLLNKPFKPMQVIEKVREILGQSLPVNSLAESRAS